jgi:hypothetical protein
MAPNATLHQLASLVFDPIVGSDKIFTCIENKILGRKNQASNIFKSISIPLHSAQLHY